PAAGDVHGAVGLRPAGRAGGAAVGPRPHRLHGRCDRHRGEDRWRAVRDLQAMRPLLRTRARGGADPRLDRADGPAARDRGEAAALPQSGARLAVKTYGALALDGKSWTMTGAPAHVAIRLKQNFPRLRKDDPGPFVFPDSDETRADLDWFLKRYP